ncbi:zinc ribbon domain-containing protein [Nocardia sp. NPDC056541]|uniref:zinc ribbon domain-containing protein n=1 Tax=Nocardia sp. NPDC056541 TaxID=3345860 RepID=UPI003670B210
MLTATPSAQATGEELSDADNSHASLAPTCDSAVVPRTPRVDSPRDPGRISDVGWADFARLLIYKQAWRSGTATADRWYPSSKRCSACATINPALKLADRVFICGCGFRADRDHNAAINLACWPTIHQDAPRSPDPPSKRPGYQKSADGKALTDTLRVSV